MPVVPRIEGRQVAPAPLPAARRRAAATPLSEGAGLELARAQTALAGAGVGAIVAEQGLQLFARQEAERRRAAKEARRQADTLALVAADNRLAEWVRDRVHDPEQGALTIKGKDALPLPEQLGQEFATLAGEVEASLKTPEQRVGFARVRASREQALDLEIRRHVAREIQTYAANELKARVDNALQLTIANGADPALANVELAAGVQAIEALGRQAGLGPDAIGQQVRALRSEAVVGIISKLLAEGRTAAARAYFEESRDVIAGDKLDDVQRALRAGTVRQQAQQEADRIVGAGGTLTEQRERAKAIEDAEVRDQVLQYVEHEAAVRDREDREAKVERLRGAYDVLDRTGDVRGIAADVWTQLDGNERAALFTYARQRAAGVPVQTNWETYYSLLQMAADEPEQFATLNLYGKRHLLDDVEFKQVAELQLRMKSAERRPDDVLAGFRTKDDILTDTLLQYGINPKTDNKKQLRAIAQLRRMLDLRVEAAQAEGRKVTNVEIQQALDGLLSARTPDVKGFWTSILPGGAPWTAPFFDQPGKRFIDLTVEDIPTATRQQVEEALRAKGRPVTDQTVLDLFLETMIRAGR